jgi:hypothetical protein
MTPRLLFAALAFAALIAPAVREARADAPDLAALARDAVFADEAAAEAALRVLRAAGPPGLEALLALRDAIDAGRPQGPWLHSVRWATPAPSDEAKAALARRLFAAIDRVAAQKDARFAGLYWHTDEAEALRRAASEGKPVLSLRLLGRLDEDASCANSRFFRTALYPDPEVGRVLRERYVLHWQSMRPVPRITIDFGDGRVIERPITGNSVHLVLDAEGRVLDAIPGLLGPGTFRAVLASDADLAQRMAGLDAAPRADALRAHHMERIAALDKSWQDDLAALGRPHARPQDLDDPDLWTALAKRHAADARLTPASVAVFREKHRAVRVNSLTVGKMLVEDPVMRAVQRFQSSLAADAVRNEQRMHRRVHEWFAAWHPPMPAQAFADRVYREIFLTPPEDPWLGLVPADEYAALEGGGLREPAAVPPGR